MLHDHGLPIPENGHVVEINPYFSRFTKGAREMLGAVQRFADYNDDVAWGTLLPQFLQRYEVRSELEEVEFLEKAD